MINVKLRNAKTKEERTMKFWTHTTFEAFLDGLINGREGFEMMYTKDEGLQNANKKLLKIHGGGSQ